MFSWCDLDDAAGQMVFLLHFIDLGFGEKLLSGNKSTSHSLLIIPCLILNQNTNSWIFVLYGNDAKIMSCLDLGSLFRDTEQPQFTPPFTHLSRNATSPEVVV